MGRGNIGEEYRGRVSRKSSLALRSVRSDTIGDIMNQNKNLESTKQQSRAQDAMPANPESTYKHTTGNRRNESTLFNPTVNIDNLGKTRKILQMYKKMKKQQKAQP